jgi:hypothetical protein
MLTARRGDTFCNAHVASDNECEGEGFREFATLTAITNAKARALQSETLS